MAIIVNGKAGDFFQASRGLRQVADVLGRIIDLAKDKGVIEGFVVGRDRIGEESKVGSLLKILRIFEIVSGLKGFRWEEILDWCLF
ncbi:hypothetical protein CsSME_00037459 [Camellia sinensis var. sinensis]